MLKKNNGQSPTQKLSDFKLLALDMDGTSLNSKGELSQNFIDFINSNDFGELTIVFATGRMPMAVHQSLNQLSISKIVISHNGALISNLETGEIYYQSSLSKDLVDYAIGLHQEYSIPLHLNLPDQVVTDKLSSPSLSYAHHLQITIDEVDFKQVQKEVISLLFIGEKSQLQLLLNQFEYQFLNFSFVLIPDRNYWLLQFLPQDTSKGKGVLELAKKLEVPSDGIISFGDSYNDMELLEYSGFGVAMGNACDELKNIADFVTTTNDDDGVLKLLTKMF